MSWLKERLAEQQAFRARREAIIEAAPRIYDTLWEQIAAFVREAQENGVKIDTNGAAYDRVVQTFPGREMHIRLGEGKQYISVSGLDLRFDLTVRPDGVVSMMLGNSPVSIADAAVKILDQFLFPELPRKY